MSKVKDMTQGPPMRLILSFALPLMLGNVGQQFYTVVDAIIVGRGVGVTALASLGATDWIYWMFQWSIFSLTQGFSILIAQRFGAKDAGGLRKAFTMSCLLSAVIGMALTAISLAAAEPLLRLLNTPEAIYNGARSYLYTLFTGTMIVVAYNMSSAILRALGDSKTPLIAMLIAAVVNVTLDLLFVMQFGWGIVGAGVATLIAQLVAFSYCLLAIRHIEILHCGGEEWRPDWVVIPRLLRLGIPLALQDSIIAIGGMVVQFVLNGFGFLFVAGFTATNKLYGLLESTGVSFGHSMTTYMGQNLGAGKVDRIRSGMRAVLKLSVCVSTTISVSMLLLGRRVLGLFVSADEAQAELVLAIAYRYLRIMCVALVLLYLLHAYRSSLQGLGNTTAPLLSGVLEFTMRVGIALVLPRLVGETGIFFAEPAAWFGAVAVLVTSYYWEVRRIRARLTAPGGTPEQTV